MLWLLTMVILSKKRRILSTLGYEWNMFGYGWDIFGYEWNIFGYEWNIYWFQVEHFLVMNGTNSIGSVFLYCGGFCPKLSLEITFKSLSPRNARKAIHFSPRLQNSPKRSHECPKFSHSAHLAQFHGFKSTPFSIWDFGFNSSWGPIFFSRFLDCVGP